MARSMSNSRGTTQAMETQTGECVRSAQSALEADWSPISVAVERAVSSTTAFGFEIREARYLIEHVLKYWLPHDLAHLAVTGVECEVELVVPHVPRVHGYIDVRGVTESGERVIIDWKTANGELDKKWTERLLDSWQWRIYAYATNATHVLYRGVSRNGAFRTVTIEVPPNNATQVELHIQQLHAMRGLLTSSAVPWPRNKPEACNAFGRPCPHLAICRGGLPTPQGVGKPTHSYSSLKVFQLCPERARLDAVLATDEDSEEASFGRIVHAGLAAAYRCAFSETIVFPSASR